jgi:hypothetical protein
MARSLDLLAGKLREIGQIKADYLNGALTQSLPKRESQAEQIKVNVGTHAMAAVAGAR